VDSNRGLNCLRLVIVDGESVLSDVTLILTAIEQGDADASARLLPVVYEELRKLARQHMAHEKSEHTLQPTALVHEAYLRLVGDVALKLDNRGRFFATASEAMRRILIEHARRKRALKRGGGGARADLEEELPEFALPCRSTDELLDLSDALERFTQEDAQKAKLVELVYFAGLSLDEAGEVLSISRATANRHWIFARAWLHDAMQRGCCVDQNL